MKNTLHNELLLSIVYLLLFIIKKILLVLSNHNIKLKIFLFDLNLNKVTDFSLLFTIYK